MRSLFLLVLVAILLGLGACSNNPVLLETIPGGTPGPCMAAVIEGKLVVTPSNAVGLLEPNGTGRGLIWPAGYAGQQNGSIAIVDEKGNVVARVGDTVELGGGEVGPNDAWEVCPGTVVVKETGAPS
jgi:hypothetical protein